MLQVVEGHPNLVKMPFEKANSGNRLEMSARLLIATPNWGKNENYPGCVSSIIANDETQRVRALTRNEMMPLSVFDSYFAVASGEPCNGRLISSTFLKISLISSTLIHRPEMRASIIGRI
jgi:hypothetical protein